MNPSERFVVVPAVIILTLLLGGCSTALQPNTPGSPSPPPENPFLTHQPKVLLHDGDVVLLEWELDDSPVFWKAGVSGLPHLEAWRAAIRRKIGDRTDPAFLLRQNRKIHPWLESEDKAQRMINTAIAAGTLGRWRPMNGLESFLLDFHASRYPLVDRPSEMGELMLTRHGKVRVDYLTDGNGLPPKEGVNKVIERAAAAIKEGWVVRAFLHNHTWDFSNDKGLYALAAPSEADLHFIHVLGAKLDLDQAWIVDGFNSFELDAAQFGWSPDSAGDTSSR